MVPCTVIDKGYARSSIETSWLLLTFIITWLPTDYYRLADDQPHLLFTSLCDHVHYKFINNNNI